jgi:hypothetical protein
MKTDGHGGGMLDRYGAGPCSGDGFSGDGWGIGPFELAELYRRDFEEYGPTPPEEVEQ